MKEEKILVIPRQKMEAVLGHFQGFLPAKTEHVHDLLQSDKLEFVDRNPAETNPQLKQIIPYCILTHKGKILTYERGQSGGEQRLRTKLSIGIGGHINPIDSLHSLQTNPKTYENALERELQEELSYQSILSRQTLGFLNDDSNPVGEVHLGVVEVLELSSDTISSKEDSIQNPTLKTLAELEGQKEELENWSQLALPALKQKQESKKTFRFHTGASGESPLQFQAALEAQTAEEATQNLLKILPDLIEIHKSLDKKTLNELGIQEITIKIQKTKLGEPQECANLTNHKNPRGS
jgi:predicted NUDIX family phosphoesterase